MTSSKLKYIKSLDRRTAITLLACLGLSSALPARASASPNFVQDQIKQHTNGFSEKEIAIFLDVPEIAENGNQVKVSFEIESPMSKDDFVKEVYIFADGNPAPNVAKFEFSPFSGECFAATKMRLSKTQNIYLLAKFNNNKFALEKSAVKVTIGGCGG